MQGIFRMSLHIVLFDISTMYFVSCNPTTFILSISKDIKINIAEKIVQSRSKINLSFENISLKC